ncbi:MAG: NAD-dependent malic enzyme [Candidatus Micrarchaeota archaeon]|nr:NAD-dependent malic enzyme [Candidatus Micrarchaeota archaeon]MCX8154648.1 NAD-dependent malic enzyme [Candidatus Micrarchaeota archaeon]
MSKIRIELNVSLNSREDLSLHYTPGVGKIVEELSRDRSKVFDLTYRGDFVAILSNGTSVLGYGNLGPVPMMPVLEGKSLILRRFGRVNPIPISIRGNHRDIYDIAMRIQDNYSLIMIEDVAGPECIELHEMLNRDLEIPTFNDDMFGSAIITLSTLKRAIHILGKDDPKVIVYGAGAAGLTVSKYLRAIQINRVIVFDSKGSLSKSRTDMNEYKKEIAEMYDIKDVSLKEALKGADVFIGFSRGNVIHRDHVRLMNRDAVVFALANPIPEIDEREAMSAGNVRIYANGRSDNKNQINNSLVFPSLVSYMALRRVKLDDRLIERAIDIIYRYNTDRLVPDMFDMGFHEYLFRSLSM